MSLQINSVALFLGALVLLGILSNNSTITISAAVLLLMQQTFLSDYLPLAEKYGLTVGIIFLTIGVLSPLVSGTIHMPAARAFFNLNMLSAVLIGIAVAWIAGRGVPLMGSQPVLVTGLLIGTIIGVAFFGGVPVGPLIAAGLLSFVAGRAV
ncbi:DUF441 domain-containing protein [Neisseria sp.]|uniref:DUF441 domain-containing protein n=1 Tax=Neisseria sp. TaxID=192066 RepID=UPI00359FD6DA